MFTSQFDLPLCRVSWPGLQTFFQATLTIGHGISPAVCVITIPVESQIAAAGDLEFIQGNRRLKLTGCRVASMEKSWTSRDGQHLVVTIHDRRWKWHYGGLFGHWNERNHDLTLKDGRSGTNDTEKTPQELAKLCFEALGEKDYDVADLPNDTRPEVLWEGEPPAVALQKLCDDLGCRIVWTARDAFAIRRQGVGQQLPRESFLDESIGVDLNDAPEQFAVLLGPTLIEVHLPLEPVIGTEVFGTDKAAVPDPNRFPPGIPIEERIPRPYQRFVPLTDDLRDRLKTECPAFVWHSHREDRHISASQATQQMLQEQVLRCFRVRLPIEIPGLTKLESYEDFELTNVRCSTYTAPNGERKKSPAYVYGSFVPDYAKGNANGADIVDPASDKQYVYQQPIGIDAENKVVTFGTHVFRNHYEISQTAKAYGNALNPTEQTSGPVGFECEPPRLILVAAIRIKTADTHVFHRYAKVRPGEKPIPMAAWTKLEEYELHGVVEYRKASNARDMEEQFVLPTKIKWNENGSIDPGDTSFPGVKAIADYYLDYIQQQHEAKTPHSVTYPGLVLVELDGAIEQIIIATGNRQPCQTTVSRHGEHSSGVMVPYAERRRREQAKTWPESVRLIREIERRGGAK